MALGRGLYTYYVCINTILYSVFIKGKENAKGINAANSNDLNVYVKDLVTMFRPLLRLTPPVKFFFIPPLYYCASAAQPYTRLCVCFGSLLT